MIVRKPSEADIPKLYECILPYAGQSRQGREVSVDMGTILTSLYNVIHASNFISRMVEIDGKPVALAFGYFGNSWWKEPDCAVDFFYVHPDYTGKGIARALASAMIQAFKEQGCGWMYAGAESDISDINTRLYQNLWRKYGFSAIGGGRMILNLRGL